MSDDLEKACRDWWTDRPEQHDAAASDEQHITSLTAFVREQVERAKGAALDPWSGPLGEYRASLGKCEARIATLEAEAAANYALYEKKGTELDGTIRHIEALEAALEKADALVAPAYLSTTIGVGRICNDYLAARAKTKVKP